MIVERETSADAYHSHAERLRIAGLRPTRQRMALSQLLWRGCDRHVTAEMLHSEARRSGVEVSLATVYNTLHQFEEAGLLREIVVGNGCSYFDTNVEPHHHFLNEDTGHLIDIPASLIELPNFPAMPQDTHFSRVDVIIRVRNAHSA